MRISPSRVMISRRRNQSAFPVQSSATDGRHGRTPTHPSIGAATDRRWHPRDFTAPMLVHSARDHAVDDGGPLDAHSVLLIHGQTESSMIWTRLLPLLRRRGLRTIAVDRPSNGHAGVEAADLLTRASTLARLLDQQQQRSPAVIVGHGHGAGIALALAATAPRHVRALVLVAPAVSPRSISLTDRLLAAPLLGPCLTWLGFRVAGLALHVPALRQLILTARVGLSASDAKRVVRGLTSGPTWRSFVLEQRRLVTDAHHLHQTLSRIGCPVVIVAGTRDDIATPWAVITLGRRLPGAEVITADTGHLIPIDAPDVVASAVLRVLRIDDRNFLSDGPSNRDAS
jgi:pimeloyl-ACP methyl ester carboxylesterase